MPNSSLSEHDVLLFFQSLMEAGHAVHVFAEKEFFAKNDITMPQFGILKKLIECGGSMSNMTELWCQHHTTRGNLSGIIERMIEAGYIRHASVRNDRRQKTVSITSKGRKKVETIERQMHALIPAFIKKIGNIPLQDLT